MQQSSWHKRQLTPGDGLYYDYAASLPVYRFAHLAEDSCLVHAVFTRQGGVSRPPYASLNLGHSVGDDPAAVDANHNRVYQALGLSRSQSVTCHLTHSADVFVVTAAHRGHVVGQGDGMVTADQGVFLSMRFADCAPILLHDPVRGAVGLAHAGWRGTVKNVAGAAVHTMVRELGCFPENITAVIGPAIGPCCYEVGEDVIQAVQMSFASGAGLEGIPGPPSPKLGGAVQMSFASGTGLEGDVGRLFNRYNGRHAYFDLWEANRQQLIAAGVGRIVTSGICTACRTDQFFSHRAERGRTGRFGVVIGYRSARDGEPFR
jgi:YfiH family protein